MNTPLEINETTQHETVAKFMFLDPEDIGATDNFGEDFGLDSIAWHDLLAAVEERHGVHLRDEQISIIWSLDDLVKALISDVGDAGS